MNFEPDTEEVVRMHIQAQHQNPSHGAVVAMLILVIVPMMLLLNYFFPFTR